MRLMMGFTNEWLQEIYSNSTSGRIYTYLLSMLTYFIYSNYHTCSNLLHILVLYKCEQD
jgi:hypothetical protein